MSWKTIVVRVSDYLFLKNGQLHFSSENQAAAFPIKDINCIVIEKTSAKLSIPLLNALVKANIYVIFCDERHDPNGVILPFHNHFQPLKILNYQLEMRKNLKKQMWTKLIEAKIENQIAVCQNLKVNPKNIEKQQTLLKKLVFNDPQNYEGITAHLFFKSLYGTSFVRHTDDGINSALNYGYKIIVSAISRTIVKYGLLNYLGIHHTGKTNQFNLAYDLIEPFRPLVDYFVSSMGEEIDDCLIYNQRLKLINILNFKVMIKNQKHTVTSAIEIMVLHFVQTLKSDDFKNFVVPKLIFEN